MTMAASSRRVVGSKSTASGVLTLRDPPYAYFRLSLQSGQPRQVAAVDDITLRSYLTAALQQYLGLTGTAISVDILQTEGSSAVIRVPSDDETAVAAAVSQWTTAKGGGALSLRIEARGAWLGGVVGRTSPDNGKLWTPES
jgi:ribonuclease P/MRP protein subunit POP8